MPLEVPKFITDLATGLQAIAAQLDAALNAIKEKRNDFNKVLTQLRNYHFDFTDILAKKLDEGVKSGKIRVVQAINMVYDKGVFAALEELKKLKIDGEALDEVKIQAAVTDRADASVGRAYNAVLVAVNEIGTDKAVGEKTKRKSAVATAILEFKKVFVNYVAVQIYGLNPDDVTDDMNVDALDAKNDEKRIEALDAAGLTPEMAAALDIDRGSPEFRDAKIKNLPNLINTKFDSIIGEIVTTLGGELRLGQYFGFLELTSVADLPDGAVTRELIEANKGDSFENTVENLVDNIYRPKIQEKADNIIKTKLQDAQNLCEPDNCLPADFKDGGLAANIRGRILDNITRDEEGIKARFWDDIGGVTDNLKTIEKYSQDLQDAEKGLADAYDAFLAKVAALATEDKKLFDKISGLVDTKMKNIDSDAAVIKTLNEIKAVLTKSTGVPDFDLGI